MVWRNHLEQSMFEENGNSGATRNLSWGAEIFAPCRY